MADHLRELHLEALLNSERTEPRRLHVLELGAGAGLPGIAVAKEYNWARVTLSDYPDPKLLEALASNVDRNGVGSRCRAIPYAWGSDPHALITPFADDSSGETLRGFDVILAADTLWNPDLHAPFIHTLQITLRKGHKSRIHLVAGLHTGRYTLERFLVMAQGAGFTIVENVEKEVEGDVCRPWDVNRAETEDERERRRWVLWIVLKWG
jgi:EEF1A N-terminal glycine/lysine methyltransferase